MLWLIFSAQTGNFGEKSKRNPISAETLPQNTQENCGRTSESGKSLQTQKRGSSTVAHLWNLPRIPWKSSKNGRSFRVSLPWNTRWSRRKWRHNSHSMSIGDLVKIFRFDRQIRTKRLLNNEIVWVRRKAVPTFTKISQKISAKTSDKGARDMIDEWAMAWSWRSFEFNELFADLWMNWMIKSTTFTRKLRDYLNRSRNLPRNRRKWNINRWLCLIRIRRKHHTSMGC